MEVHKMHGFSVLKKPAKGPYSKRKILLTMSRILLTTRITTTKSQQQQQYLRGIPKNNDVCLRKTILVPRYDGCCCFYHFCFRRRYYYFCHHLTTTFITTTNNNNTNGNRLTSRTITTTKPTQPTKNWRDLFPIIEYMNPWENYHNTTTSNDSTSIKAIASLPYVLLPSLVQQQQYQQKVETSKNMNSSNNNNNDILHSYRNLEIRTRTIVEQLQYMYHMNGTRSNTINKLYPDPTPSVINSSSTVTTTTGVTTVASGGGGVDPITTTTTITTTNPIMVDIITTNYINTILKQIYNEIESIHIEMNVSHTNENYYNEQMKAIQLLTLYADRIVSAMELFYYYPTVAAANNNNDENDDSVFVPEYSFIIPIPDQSTYETLIQILSKTACRPYYLSTSLITTTSNNNMSNDIFIQQEQINQLPEQQAKFDPITTATTTNNSENSNSFHYYAMERIIEIIQTMEYRRYVQHDNNIDIVPSIHYNAIFQTWLFLLQHYSKNDSNNNRYDTIIDIDIPIKALKLFFILYYNMPLITKLPYNGRCFVWQPSFSSTIMLSSNNKNNTGNHFTYDSSTILNMIQICCCSIEKYRQQQQQQQREQPPQQGVKSNFYKNTTNQNTTHHQQQQQQQQKLNDGIQIGFNVALKLFDEVFGKVPATTTTTTTSSTTDHEEPSHLEQNDITNKSDQNRLNILNNLSPMFYEQFLKILRLTTTTITITATQKADYAFQCLFYAIQNGKVNESILYEILCYHSYLLKDNNNKNPNYSLKSYYDAAVATESNHTDNNNKQTTSTNRRHTTTTITARLLWDLIPSQWKENCNANNTEMNHSTSTSAGISSTDSATTSSSITSSSIRRRKGINRSTTNNNRSNNRHQQQQH